MSADVRRQHGGLEALRGNHRLYYVCATSRRRPGVCLNRRMYDLDMLDRLVLGLVDRRILDDRSVNELLSRIDTAPDNRPTLKAQQDDHVVKRDRLIASIQDGVPGDVVAPAIKATQAEIDRLQRLLDAPRPEQPDVERLRSALMQQVQEWRRVLRGDVGLAREVLRATADIRADCRGDGSVLVGCDRATRRGARRGDAASDTGRLGLG